MAKNAIEYFSPLIQEIKKANPALFDNISKSLSKTFENALKAISSPSTSLGKKNIIEEKILKDKIKVTSSLQKDLLNKLAEVNQQLSSLKGSIESKEKEKPSAPIVDPNQNSVSAQKELIERLHKEKNKFLEKKAKLEKKIEMEQMKKEQEIKEIEEAKRLEKHKEIQNRIKEFKSKQETQKAELQEKEAEYKAKMPSQKLFSKMKKDYNSKRKSEENARNQKLNEIHESHKPIFNQELYKFEEKFLNSLAEKDKARYDRFLQMKLDLKEREREIKEKYSTNTLQKLEALRKEELQKELEKDVALINKVLKHKEFFEKVKQYHTPKIDKNKVLELEIMKKESEIKKIAKHFVSEGDIENGNKTDTYELGLQYLRAANNKNRNNRKKINEVASLQPLEEKNEEIEENAIKSSQVIRKLEESESEKPAKSVESHSKKNVNYLKEVKEKFNLVKKPDYWKKIDQNREINSLVKLEKLRQEADEMEKKAKRKEEVLKLKRKKENFDPKLESQNQDIDDLLMNSIQAKLRLLEN